MINDTAVIGKNCKIGANVKIENYVVVGDNCLIGDNCKIGNHTIISDNTFIGANNQIGNFCSIGCNPSYPNLDLNYISYTYIGNNNIILDSTIITRSAFKMKKTKIGDDNIIASHVYLGHDVFMENNNFISTKSILAGHVKIGNYNTIGAGSFICQKLRIGNGCMIGASSKVTRDIPSYILVDGIPAETKSINIRGIKKKKLKVDIFELTNLYNNLYFQNKSYTDISKEFPNFIEIISFIENSSRGICRSQKEIKCFK